jgi:cytidylate kinase
MNFSDVSFSVARALLQSQGAMPREHKEAEAPPRWTIAISREAGALGTALAEELGRRLNWPVYDQQILNKVAEEMKRPPVGVSRIDERPVNWLEECFTALFTQQYINFGAYLKKLMMVVRGLGMMGHCVIVGRASSFILPPATTLRVRLVANRDDRIRNIAERNQLSRKEAAEWVDSKTKDRIDFVKNNFGVDPTDAHHYDLVLNTSRLSLDACARIILDALETLEPAAVQHTEYASAR